jgi:hypothetical protein
VLNWHNAGVDVEMTILLIEKYFELSYKGPCLQDTLRAGTIEFYFRPNSKASTISPTASQEDIASESDFDDIGDSDFWDDNADLEPTLGGEEWSEREAIDNTESDVEYDSEMPLRFMGRQTIAFSSDDDDDEYFNMTTAMKGGKGTGCSPCG